MWLASRLADAADRLVVTEGGARYGRPGIDLLETANLAAFTDDAGPRSGSSGWSAVQPGSVAAGGAGAAAVFESLTEVCERLDETPLA